MQILQASRFQTASCFFLCAQSVLLDCNKEKDDKGGNIIHRHEQVRCKAG